jgi:translation initiation factor 1
MSESKLVYCTDPKLNHKCPRCRELMASCRCRPEVELKSSNFTALLRIEKAGRSGKTVTVIDGLPKINVFLKDLTRDLKNRCGSGGTYDLEGKEGKIEIQGDKRELIRTVLSQRGIKTKG